MKQYIAAAILALGLSACSPTYQVVRPEAPWFGVQEDTITFRASYQPEDPQIWELFFEEAWLTYAATVNDDLLPQQKMDQGIDHLQDAVNYIGDMPCSDAVEARRFAIHYGNGIFILLNREVVSRDERIGFYDRLEQLVHQLNVNATRCGDPGYFSLIESQAQNDRSEQFYRLNPLYRPTHPAPGLTTP